MEEARFRIIYRRGAVEFLNSLSKEVRKKITYVVERSMYHMDSETFKKLAGTDIWEFRVLYDKMAYRLFAFWDTDGETLAIATHGIVKKTRKTPAKEIAKAEAERKKWFDDKNR